ncbi:hypothetical protein [Streptomyces hoynatensis]|uniref:Uncharacterized protein n=1 Tax=Streptomyces hoynatensis TaxID=1141874 RepID=A0A3A9YN67_9ACTN|nr:hypothetical protein [Streptomyces hoynatensis]RKN37502.1 hypothetical protein D7294_27570 [Streptomyces hoynatensis]
MDVTFTKAAGRRYLMRVVRERGPELAPRQGPGYDDHLPHDAVHFLVEAEAGLTRGVFGRIAAGGLNVFWPADPALRRREFRREARRRLTAADHAQMARSESLAGACRALWELRAGHRASAPAPLAGEDARLAERIVARLDAFAARWHPLPENSGITLTWPR